MKASASYQLASKHQFLLAQLGLKTPLLRAMTQSQRGFSTFSKVEGGSISISSHYPPKLRIPVSDKQQYDFSLIDSETVEQFEAKVKTQAGISNFTLDRKAAKEAKIGDIIK